MKNYYSEIDKVLRSYEEHKPWHEKSIGWCVDRVDWCWKWRKISEKQMEELADRITVIFEGM